MISMQGLSNLGLLVLMRPNVIKIAEGQNQLYLLEWTLRKCHIDKEKWGNYFAFQCHWMSYWSGKLPSSTSSFGSPLKVRIFSASSTISFSLSCHSHFTLFFAFLLSKVLSSVLSAAVPPSKPTGHNTELHPICVCKVGQGAWLAFSG